MSRKTGQGFFMTHLKKSTLSDWLICAIHLPADSMLTSLSLFGWQFWYVVFVICYKRNGKYPIFLNSFMEENNTEYNNIKNSKHLIISIANINAFSIFSV